MNLIARPGPLTRAAMLPKDIYTLTHKTDTVTFTVLSGAASWLTPLVSHRLQTLGHGRIVDRAEAQRVAGSVRAGDQFLYASVRKGLLVPTTWGRYAVPRPQTVELLRRIPDPRWALLISHAQTVPWILKEASNGAPLLGFLAARLWNTLRLEAAGSAPVYALTPNMDRLPVVPMQRDAFLIDSLGPDSQFAEVRIGAQTVRVPVPSRADTARLLESGLDPRLTRLSHELLADATTREDGLVRETKPRWSPPQSTPQPSRAARLRIPAGPPQNHRLFAPPWYMDLTRAATEALQRRAMRNA